MPKPAKQRGAESHTFLTREQTFARIIIIIAKNLVSYSRAQPDKRLRFFLCRLLPERSVIMPTSAGREQSLARPRRQRDIHHGSTASWPPLSAMSVPKYVSSLANHSDWDTRLCGLDCICDTASTSRFVSSLSEHAFTTKEHSRCYTPMSLI
jgi:hypothetical protein